jgi:uncharacterized coiled-coil protein SlyX
LFGEVVRLGEQTEQTVEFLKDLALNLENRLATFEGRVNTGEQTIAQLKSGYQDTSTETRRNYDQIDKVDT